MFEEYMTRSIPDIAPDTLEKAKENHFAEWCKDYVSYIISKSSLLYKSQA